MNLDEIKPPTGAKLVTKSNTLPIVSALQHARELRVGGAGNVAIRMLNGDEVTLNGCVVGERILGFITHVLDTGTTATDIVAFY